MNPIYLEIIILAFVGILGQFAHSFKAVYDKNKAQEAEYTFGMYWKKNRFIMYFVWICVIVFAYYQHEWTKFESLGEARGIFLFIMGYMGDSAFPSLFEILPIIIEKAKAKFGAKKDSDAA